MKIYVVRQAIWGSDLRDKLVFSSKKEAEQYYDTHDFCDLPYVMNVSERRGKELLSTMCDRDTI